MKKQYLFLLTLMLINFDGFCQYPDWVNYTNGKNVQCVLNDGNYIWAGTNGGLARMEKSTGNFIFYNKTNSGIPHLGVTALAKDNQGNLWVGTQGGGVAKFTGTSWTIYNSYISPSFPFNINDIEVDPSGAVWICGGSSISKFFNNVWTHYPGSGVNGYNGFESLAFDSNGILYVGTGNNGLLRFDGTTWTQFTVQNSAMLNNRIHDIAIDSQNNVWAGSSSCGGAGGITKFDGTTFTMYFLNTQVDNIAIDSSDNIWISIFPNKLAKWDGTTLVNFDTTNSQITNIANDFVEDNGTIWFGTSNSGGLNHFDGSYQVTNFNIDNFDISSNSIRAMAVDSNGTLWSANGSQGFDKFDQTGFTNFNMSNSGLPVEYVYSLAVDPFNNLWMGSIDGVIKYDGTNFTHFDSATFNLPSSKMFAPPVFDSNGNVYCLFRWYYDSNGARAGGGIARYNGNAWTKINLSVIPDSSISRIMIDKQNQLWATGDGIIEKHNLFAPVVFNASNSVINYNDHFTSLLSDNDNNVWTSTYNGLIYKIEASQTITTYNVTPCNIIGLGDIILTMAIDVNNNLWAGILDMCSDDDILLAKFDGVSFNYYGIQNSGLSTMPESISCYKNKIFFGTQNGIVEYTDSTIFTGVSPGAWPPDILIVFPNPTSDFLTINTEMEKETTMKIEVINYSGQIVFSQTGIKFGVGHNSFSLDLVDLSSGIYVLKLVSDYKTYSTRVVLTNLN